MFAYRPVCELSDLDPKNNDTLASRRRLRRAALVALTLLLGSLPAFSATIDAAALAGLKKLDLGTRLEQRCDMEAMARIDHDKKGYAPERVVAAASADTEVDGDLLEGKGAAVRSKGKWYSLSFVCKTSADHMEVLSFDYQIGDPIPKEKWEEYNLFD